MIVIYGIAEKLNPIKAKLSDVIHGCMMSVLGTLAAIDRQMPYQNASCNKPSTMR